MAPKGAESQCALERAMHPSRNLSSNDIDIDFSRSSTSSHAGCLKQGKEVITSACEMSWPKRRVMKHRSINIHATSPRLRFQPNKRESDCDAEQFLMSPSDWTYKAESQSGLVIQHVSVPAEIRSSILNNAAEASSESLQQSKRHSITKVRASYES